eukprot:11162508-Lingulodinium_polyedra.AAC.1
MGAAGGTTAGMYGAACGPPPTRELVCLRRAARDAVMRGASRCASEVVFGVLSPTWRLDPAALACIGPVAQAVRALRANNVEIQ